MKWFNLTLNVRGPSYLGLTRSISWLLMPWLLTSPGHQQPWYWLCRICRSWSYLRKDFITSVKSMWSNGIKCKYMFTFPLKNLAHKRSLRSSIIMLLVHDPLQLILNCKQFYCLYPFGFPRPLTDKLIGAWCLALNNPPIGQFRAPARSRGAVGRIEWCLRARPGTPLRATGLKLMKALEAPKVETWGGIKIGIDNASGTRLLWQNN